MGQIVSVWDGGNEGMLDLMLRLGLCLISLLGLHSQNCIARIALLGLHC